MGLASYRFFVGCAVRTAGYAYSSVRGVLSPALETIFSGRVAMLRGFRTSGRRRVSDSAESTLDFRSGGEQICQASVTRRWVQGLHLLLPVQEGRSVQGGDLIVIACHAIDLCFDGPTYV